MPLDLPNISSPTFVKWKNIRNQWELQLSIKNEHESEEKLTSLTFVFPDCSLFFGWLQTCGISETSRFSQVGWHYPWHWPSSLSCCVLESTCGPVHMEHCGVGQGVGGLPPSVKGKIPGFWLLVFCCMTFSCDNPASELSSIKLLIVSVKVHVSQPSLRCLQQCCHDRRCRGGAILACLYSPPIMMRYPWISFLSLPHVGG